MHICAYLCTELFITGVPGKVPNVTVTNSSDGNVVNFTLTWREPVNHLDSIIMYNVSCLGDPPCPQSYNTSNNQTRSHIFTNFTTNNYYKFSIVAINSIGSGEAGVEMVGEITIATTVTSVVSMSTTTIVASSAVVMSTTTISNVKVTTNISSDNMMSTSIMNMTSNMSSTSILPTMTSTQNMISSIVTTSSIVSSTVGMALIL